MIKEEWNEEWYVILNMNCKYEICRMCPKSGLFKGSYEECEKWIKQKQKEEKKDEMKNRISMALKDPILQQGFEIICKENAELKKELKDADEKVVHLACNQNKDLKNKLTKAKEIIKEFVMWANWNGANCPNFKDIQSKAEQFLKEIEK